MLGSTIDTNSGGGLGSNAGGFEDGSGTVGSSSGDSNALIPVPSGSPPQLDIGPCYQSTTDGTILALLLGTYLLVGIGLASVHNRVLGLVVVLVLVAGTAVGIGLLTLGCSPEQDNNAAATMNNTGFGQDPPDSGGGAGESSSPAPPSLLLVALLVIGLAGTIGVLYAVDSTDTSTDQSDADVTTDADRAAIGRAAGRAADELDPTEATENAVYRAWDEMTAELPVDSPASSTPSEFATAAVEAGMERENVADLTALFRQVRYGDADPTPGREQRARAALRRIEASYVGSADADHENDKEDRR
jgi:hypothetical protein